MENKINDYINLEISTIKNIDEEKIKKVINILDDALQNEKNIYVFGNGGSGSTASHMYNDFVKAIFEKTSKRFKINCLNDNIPSLLAISNDIGYDEVFRYQLKRCGIGKDDIIIALSGSGNSRNIINAVMYAKENNSLVIGLTGYDGGELKKLSDYSLDTNINNMRITEDIHLMFNHLIINIFYEMYGVGEYK